MGKYLFKNFLLIVLDRNWQRTEREMEMRIDFPALNKYETFSNVNVMIDMMQRIQAKLKCFE